MKHFIILSGFNVHWLDSEEELNKMLDNGDLVCKANLGILVCGHIDENNIYFYNGNKEVNCRVIEVANKWHNVIGADKKLHYGLSFKKAV